MSKPSKRPGRAARDIHAAIREQAARLREAPMFGFTEAAALPEVAELLTAARGEIERAIPASLVFSGRRYYLRVRLGLQIDVFDSPGAAEPLIVGASLSDEGFGHAPGH